MKILFAFCCLMLSTIALGKFDCDVIITNNTGSDFNVGFNGSIYKTSIDPEIETIAKDSSGKTTISVSHKGVVSGMFTLSDNQDNKKWTIILLSYPASSPITTSIHAWIKNEDTTITSESDFSITKKQSVEVEITLPPNSNQVKR